MVAAAVLNLLFLSIFYSNGLFSVSAVYITQNFIHLRQSAAELLLFVQKSKMATAAILNYNFVMLEVHFCVRNSPSNFVLIEECVLFEIWRLTLAGLWKPFLCGLSIF